MIAYNLEIIIDEEHEEQFNDIIESIITKAKTVEGVEEVNRLPESYFEYNDDSDPFWVTYSEDGEVEE